MSKPTFEETVDKAARAVYARTPSSETILFDLLPNNVQDDIREIAKTAITVALIDLRETLKESN